MKLTEKQLKRLKTKLALDGTGSKKKLAEKLRCNASYVTYILNTGLVSSAMDDVILDYIA